MAWKCPIGKVGLQRLVYIPDPTDSFSNIQITPTFIGGGDSDTRTWNTDCLQTKECVQAVIDLTAWLIKYKGGFCTLFIAEGINHENIKVFWKKDDFDKKVKEDNLFSKDLDEILQKDLDIIWQSLIDIYGKDNYLDI